MSPPFFLDLDYEIVTPLFLSGADPAHPELRAASVRGAVRAWYRAIDPWFLRDEVRWMGAADQPAGTGDKVTQQSPWLLRVMQAPTATFSLDRAAYRRFERGTPPERTNGVLYTGFSLHDRFNARGAFAASTAQAPVRFTLRLIIPRPSAAEDAAPPAMTPRGFVAVLGAFWLLGHLGALGSRARRAWGSVQLRGVRGVRVPEPFAQALQRLQPAPADSAAAWRKGVEQTLSWLREQLGGERPEEARQVGHLGVGSQVRLLRQGHREWAAAVDEVGARMQAFRRTQRQDRELVLGMLMRLDPRLTGAGPQLPPKMRVAPRRVAFGLPLTFRFGLTPRRVKELKVDRLNPESVEFVPAERARDDDGPSGQPSYDRHPGLVTLRVVRLGSAWHGLVVRLSGASPGARDLGGSFVGTQEAAPHVYARAGRGRDGVTLPTAGDSILDEWLRELAAVSEEVRL
jgi:CRISPR-associated protein Cmr1